MDKHQTYSAEAVANYFLDIAANDDCEISNIRMQKLVYFAHGFYLGVNHEPLIHDDIAAWTYGPVIPPLYRKLKKHGSQPITGSIECEDRIMPKSKEALTIKLVWDQMKQYTAGQLVNLTHAKGTAWDIVWNSEDGKYKKIPDALIIKDFE